MSRCASLKLTSIESDHVNLKRCIFCNKKVTLWTKKIAADGWAQCRDARSCMIRQLIDTPDHSLDSLESSTMETIARAQKLLRKYK